MMTEEQVVCLDAMQSWGFMGNFGMLAEETGEMLSAINKLIRGRVERKDVITELADVSLVITAFAMELGYSDFQEEKKKKLLRLKERLEEWHKNNDEL